MTRPIWGKSVDLLPLPARITGDRYSPGDRSRVATRDTAGWEAERDVIILVQIDDLSAVVQFQEDAPELDILKGEVEKVATINLVVG